VVIIAIAAVVFALQNAGPVTISFFMWDLPQASLALVLLITLIIGIIIGLLFLTSSVYRRNKTITTQKKRIEELENAAVAMKSNIPGE